ncbi:MAG TPA: DCC1-like thiol-disulfide oxidoreductase family protein [Actinomycetota bacterium]|nr:DCC1-like thiol-disulfide oxidoreductase family protein [Actinomycetota bacterium]
MTDEQVILFYDAGCPGCRLFARIILAADRERRIRTAPLDSPEAGRILGGMSKGQRFASYHLVIGDRVVSGASGMGPLLEQPTLLRPLGRLVRRSPTARAAAAGAYRFAARHRGAVARLLPRVELPR